jgi:predicted XRE-type DNA-binding protein
MEAQLIILQLELDVRNVPKLADETRLVSVWDALIDDPEEDLKKRSDYFILIWARLNGQSGSQADKAKRFGLPVDQIHDLLNGKINKFSLPLLIGIARKIGVTVRL